MAVTIACHVESVAGSGAAFVVATCQGVVEPHSIRRREWSRFAAITVACRVEPVVGVGRAVQNPSQGVEQSRGRCCGLLEGLGLSAKVRLESDLRRSPDGNHLSRSLSQGHSW